MSKVRSHKKRLNLIEDKEEMAKQQLFEISHHFDQYIHDESNILLDTNQHNFYQNNTIATNIRPKPHFIYKKKPRNLRMSDYGAFCQKFNESKVQHRNKTQRNTLKDESTIENAIQSSSVFVANKNIRCRTINKEPYQKNYLVFADAHHNETMPFLNLQTIRQKTKNNYLSNKLKWQKEGHNQDKKKHKINYRSIVKCMKINRQNYTSLKQKLLKDLFITLQVKSRPYS